MINIIFNTSDKLFNFGAVITIFFSFVIGFLNIGVLYLFGIPLIGLTLGIIIVWLSKVTIKKKLLLTFLPLFLMLWAFFMFNHLRKAEPETFLIPADFRGNIIIFYEESCGEKPLYENGRRIYEFPENGILITNLRRPRGYLNQEFYFVDKNGNRTPIVKREIRDFNFKGRLSKIENEPRRDEIAAFYSNSILLGVFGSVYHVFLISTFQDTEKSDKESWKELQQLSKSAETLLKACHQNQKN